MTSPNPADKRDEIRRYFFEYYGVYPRDAIRTQLLRSGYEWNDILAIEREAKARVRADPKRLTKWEEIRRYLAENLGKYGADALRTELLKAGYDRSDIIAVEALGSVWEGEAQVVVRSYPGRTQADAAQLFAIEAKIAGSYGFKPSAQSWGEGRPGVGRVVMLGLFANSIRPMGFLTVTYERVAAAATDDRPIKRCPDCGETVLAVARICRFCRHDFTAG